MAKKEKPPKKPKKKDDMAAPTLVNKNSVINNATLASFNVGTADYLVVEVQIQRASGIGSITGVTFNGVAMTPNDNDIVSDTMRVYRFVKTVSASDTGNIVATVSGSQSGMCIVARSFLGVISLGTAAKNKQTTGTTISTAVTATADDLVVDALGIFEVNSTTPAVAGSQTLDEMPNTGGIQLLGASRLAGASSMGWTSLQNNSVIHLVLPLKGTVTATGGGRNIVTQHYHRHAFGG